MRFGKIVYWAVAKQYLLKRALKKNCNTCRSPVTNIEMAVEIWRFIVSCTVFILLKKYRVTQFLNKLV